MSNTTTIFQPHTILSAHLTGDGERLNIVRKYPSNMTYGNGQPVPDRVEKEVYGVVDGKIVLIETKTGKHTPAYMVKETVTFDE
jgi:hypothetical protein